MADIRTSIIVEGKSKNLEALDKSLAHINATAAAAAGKPMQGYAELEKILAQSTGTVTRLGVAMRLMAKQDVAKHLGVVKAGEGIKSVNNLVKQLGETMKKPAAAAEQMGRALDNVERKAKRAKRALDDAGAGGGGGGGGGHGRRRKGGGSGEEDAKKSHGAFTQGFLEGAMPGPLSRIIDRGPGAFRQSLGIMVGQKLHDAVGGIASTPMSGDQGLVTAAGAISPAIAGMLAKSLGQARQAIAFRRQESSLSPFLGGAGMAHGGALEGMQEAAAARAGLSRQGVTAQAEAARQRARRDFDPHFSKYGRDIVQDAARSRQRDINDLVPGIASRLGLDPSDASDRDRAEMHAAQRLGIRATPGINGLSGRRGGPVFEPVSDKYMNRVSGVYREQEGEDAANAAREEAEKRRAGVMAEVRARTMGGIQSAGERLGGMDLGETQSFLARMAMAGGGTARDAMRQGLGATGIAANTVYGIGPETTGKFVQAARVGGIAGGGLGGGRGGQSGEAALVKAINQGLKLGLEGSELTDYMQQMAQGIDAWKTTGIPLAQDSIGKLGVTLAQVGGMGGQRAALASGQAVQSLQGLARSGPQSAAQVLQTQVIGGYQGGGIDKYLQARKYLEKGGDKDLSGRVEQYARIAMRAGKGGKDNDAARARGTLVLQGALQEMGINLSTEEAELYQRQLEGRTTKEDRAGLSGLRSKLSGTNAATMQAQAGGITGKVNREEAEKRNRERESGDKFIPTVQSMEAATQSVTEAFGRSAEIVNKLAETLASAIETLAGAVKAAGAPAINPKRAPHGKL